MRKAPQNFLSISRLSMTLVKLIYYLNAPDIIYVNIDAKVRCVWGLFILKKHFESQGLGLKFTLLV